MTLALCNQGFLEKVTESRSHSLLQLQREAVEIQISKIADYNTGPSAFLRKS